MPSDKRRDAATASVGAAGLAAGGLMRHGAVSSMTKKPKIHMVGVLRNGTKAQRKVFLGGSALGLLSTAPLGVGTTRLLADEPVGKKDNKPGFWREGLSGSAEALHGRGKNALEPVPVQARGIQLGAAGAAGLAGSAISRGALPKKLRPVAGPIAGALTATGSIPLTNKAVKAKYPEYKVTALGVQREKKAIKRPSSQSFRHRDTPRSFRADIGKADKPKSYLGSRTPYATQRAAITAAGGTPAVGPITGAIAAGRYAPPGQERKTAVRQWAMGPGAGAAAGIGGAYAGARYADKSERGLKIAEGTIKGKDWAEDKVRAGARKVRSGLGMSPPKPPGPIRTGLADKRTRLMNRAKASRIAGPLTSNPRRIAGATAGFFGAKAIAGSIGGQSSITLSQRNQSRYNAKHGISKGESKREKHSLANTKRTNAALAYTSGTLGLTALGLLKKKPLLATKLSIVAGGVGGTNSLIGAQVQRREARRLDPVRKGLGPQRTFQLKRLQDTHVRPEATALLRRAGQSPAQRQKIAVGNARHDLRGRAADKQAYAQLRSERGLRVSEVNPRTMAAATKPSGPGRPVRYGKRSYSEPLKTSVSEDDTRKLVDRHGLKGSLPKTLDREQRRAAYEARYVSAGGKKAEHWQRRAVVADKTKTAGLAGATAGGAVWLGSRVLPKTRPAAAAARKIPALKKINPKKVSHHAETASGAAAVVAGG
ncbi:MAG: hypothetical protein ABIO67_06605, partial [Mycobacteriales bacterium]